MRSDILIVGGGIVGLSTAYKLSLRHPNRKIVLLEKESRLATHQTGRNSGVIHSGIYYKPGSFKATTCRNGKAQLERFCRDHGVKYEVCGKVIVATDESEIPAMERVFERGPLNGVQCERIGPERIRELEPAVTKAISGIHVPETGIVDYVGMCEALGRLIEEAGHTIQLNSKVCDVQETAEGVSVESSTGTLEAKYLVNCAGLYSDRVARMAGLTPKVKIVPFRGEYFELTHDAEHLCKNLIYPVPDPSFPFLGVHFTRMVLGGVECGPNAVLAFAREGYGKTTLRPGELFETLTFPGFLKIAKKHYRMGAMEMARSFSKGLFVRALQRLIPEIEGKQLTAAQAGVRAQAVSVDGSLVDDFAFEESPRAVHVLNAPSPAATASLAIGDLIADRLETRFH